MNILVCVFDFKKVMIIRAALYERQGTYTIFSLYALSARGSVLWIFCPAQSVSRWYAKITRRTINTKPWINKRKQGEKKNNNQHMHIKSGTRFLPNAITLFFIFFIPYIKKREKNIVPYMALTGISWLITFLIISLKRLASRIRGN